MVRGAGPGRLTARLAPSLAAANMPEMNRPARSLDEIASYHAHVYYDPATTRARAERLRAGVAERFSVRLGRWYDVNVGPHSQAMFQIAFAKEVFETLTPWLMLNNEGLSILIHPNTRDPRGDHTGTALWIGAPVPVREEVLPDAVDRAEPAGAPNTEPTFAP